MKNFKKVLALVLAIATLLSFATVASAKTADFADAKDVKNVEAVDVLSYIKVLEGYPADNTFKPAKNITREEAAKIIAIFANKSTDISSLYTSANPFADMKGRWGESYVAYGYRAGIIAGKNATSFVPKANVKGTEFLKMVLVVLGYDQNKEGLVGSSWAVNTLELAKAKKLLAGLGKDFDANAALTRDQAAQIMLNALKAEKVVYGQTITNLTWNAKTGYWMTTNTTANAVYVSPNGAVNNYEHKLLAADFNLTLTETQDKWGRPTHTWNKGTATIGEYVDSDKLVKSYYTAVTECDIANDVGFKTEKIYPIFVNGQTPVKYNVQATDTVAKLGAQGRLTEVYEDRIVMIDTFLAKVEKVTNATFDAAGHLKTPSQIDLTVYDGATNNATVVNAAVVLKNGSTNYTYVKGDYVLVNAYTTNQGVATSGQVIPTTQATAYAEIAGKAESFEGAQTVIWFNAGKHTVDGTAYDDALEFHLNKDTKKIAKMMWFKDLYGNLIGVTEIEATYAYGVITAIRNAGDFSAFGASKTYANVKYVDGTDNTVTVNSIKPLGFTNAQKPVAGTYNAALMTFTDNVNGTFSVSYDSAQNEKNDPKDIVDGHLFRIETLADGTVNLVEMAPNYTGAQTMIARGLLVVPATTASTTTTVKVDDATKFLLRSADKVDGAYVYTAITGVKDFAKYSQANQAVVDAVIDNGYASIVYIIGDSDAAKAKGFSYIVGSTYNAQLKTDADAIKYYEVILATKTEDGTANEVLKVKATDTALLNTLIASSNYGKLFYIETTGGYVSGVQKVGVVDSTSGKTWTTHTAGETAPYYHYHQYNDKVDTSYAVGYDNKTLKNAAYGNNILTLGAGNSFYVVTDTVVVGDLNVLTDKVIYVIGNEDGSASKVYVVDNDAAQGSTVPGKATLTYVAKLYNKNGDYVKDIVMGTQEVAFTNPSALSETFTPSYAVAHGYMTAPVAGFTGTATASVDAAVLNGYQLTGNDAQSVTVVSGEAKTVTWMLIAK